MPSDSFPSRRMTVTYIVIDVVPKNAVNDSQVRETLETAPDPDTLESVPDAMEPSVTEST